MDLSYVIEKIRDAEFSDYPFRHLEINDLFKVEDFKAIVKAPEVSISASSDSDLFHELFKNQYKIISFPGCTNSYTEYMSWHKNKKVTRKISTSCEGYGVVLRLETPQTSPIETLLKFINSDEFIEVMADKFGLDTAACNYDSGLQKYMDGYEISPHPDVRRKALTYMVNINPNPNSSETDHHTSYLEIKPEWEFVKTFWAGNKKSDRCWIPWDWCNVVKQQRNNNSMVIFSPSNDTLHAVKADYDHLPNQRTQLYGNLWFDECQVNGAPQWEDFVISPTLTLDKCAKAVNRQAKALKRKAKKQLLKYIPTQLKSAVKKKILSNSLNKGKGKEKV